MPLGFTVLNERSRRPNPLINFIKPLSRPWTVKPASDVFGTAFQSASYHSQPQQTIFTGASNGQLNTQRKMATAEKEATHYLSAIAAVVYPLMKRHHIAVQTLEEFPPNREFAGRNFNAGEAIQLVIRYPVRGARSGRDGSGGQAGPFLPARHVQMVMIHELAHCKQMNHSKAFWKVRDMLAGELRELWARGYTGEGLWARGQMAGSGALVNGVGGRGVGVAEWEPKSLCGGTFKSRGGGRSRKRKRGGKDAAEKETYAERQQRRILRKFGAGGVSLGSDVEGRARLESSKSSSATTTKAKLGATKTASVSTARGAKAKTPAPPKGKPRVANSARGRELRAAAALARFDKVKTEAAPEDVNGSQTQAKPKSKIDDFFGSPSSPTNDAIAIDNGNADKKMSVGSTAMSDTDSETDSELEWELSDDESKPGTIKREEDDARDADGVKILDGKGRSFKRVCGDEDGNSVENGGIEANEVTKEMEELKALMNDDNTTQVKQEDESGSSVIDLT